MKKIWGCRKKILDFLVMQVMWVNPSHPALGPRGLRVMWDGPKRMSGLEYVARPAFFSTSRTSLFVIPIVHIDVCVPSEKSLGGAYYFVSFIDVTQEEYGRTC